MSPRRNPRPTRLSLELPETLEPMILMSAGVTDLDAFHRDGQRF